MAGLHFEYDERGSTFYYFLVSFYALVLIPATYYLWPRSGKKDSSSDLKSCRCEACLQKDKYKKSNEPWKKLKNRIIKIVFIILWIGFALLVYKASQVENEHVEWNPYHVLGLDSGASIEEVKKAYRQLSKIHHPDRGGEEKRFVEITKAHLALTDEESKKNYDLYGNPDGPGAQTFGIALPSWIVSKEYSVWVLAVYGLIFMVIMPLAVGIWWYRSIKYSADSVLLDTTQMFTYMIHKTSLLNVKRVITILSGSFEYWKQYNKEVVERPSDDVEVPLLIKQFPNVGENKKERPLCFPYSIKARALLFAHLSRHSLYEETLKKDLQLILKKCPYLIQELIQVYSQLVMLANAGRVPRMPALDTLDNIMKVSPIIVQATWDNKSPLLQLPHIGEDTIRHFVTKKRHVKSCVDLVRLPNEDRRSLLRTLSDREYHDVMVVLASMPQIEMEIRLEVRDDEDKERITAGALVTVIVKLKRTPLMDSSTLKHTIGNATPSSNSLSSSSENVRQRNSSNVVVVATNDVERTEDEGDDVADEDQEEGERNGEGPSAESNQNAVAVVNNQQATKRNMWEKPKKKKAGKNTAKHKKKPPFKPVAKKVDVAQSSTTTEQHPEKSKNDAESGGEGSDDEKSVGSSDEDALKDIANDRMEEEDDFELDEDFTRKEKILETKSKITHLVHCPHFPEDKYEYWWLYLCDRKKKQLICPPSPVTTLVNEEEVELRFAAPKDPGTYNVQVCLRSDSYMDCDQSKEVKYTVHEAKQITSHPQWEFAEDEDKKSEQEMSDDASEYTEDDEDSN